MGTGLGAGLGSGLGSELGIWLGDRDGPRVGVVVGRTVGDFEGAMEGLAASSAILDVDFPPTEAAACWIRDTPTSSSKLLLLRLLRAAGEGCPVG